MWPLSNHFLGCFLLLKVLLTQSCLTLYDPMDCSPPGSSVHGILQARILEWVAISFSRWSARPRERTCISCIGSRFSTTESPGKPTHLQYADAELGMATGGARGNCWPPVLVSGHPASQALPLATWDEGWEGKPALADPLPPVDSMVHRAVGAWMNAITFSCDRGKWQLGSCSKWPPCRNCYSFWQ